MNMHKRPFGRGLKRALMDGGSDIASLQREWGNFQTAFNAFKDANDQRLRELEKGKSDPVTNEKVDKINQAIDLHQKALDEIAQNMAAATVGAAAHPRTPEQREHAEAMSAYMRTGDSSRISQIRNAATAGSGPDGGWTVSPQTETNIDRVLGTISVMRSIAQVLSISAGVYRKPVAIGGTGYGWVGETNGRPQTNTPTLTGLDFPTMELYAMPAATQTLLDDSSIDIEAWLADEVNMVFAEQEGAAFISGNGQNKPEGIFGLKSVQYVADANYAWGKLGYVKTGDATGFAATNPENALIDLQTSLKTGYVPNARWLMNRKTQGEIRKFKDANGNMLWQPGLQPGEAATLFGKPIAADDAVADLGENAFPLAYGDFKRGYLIVDRIGVRVLRDPYSAKPYVLFYTTKRVGGGIQNFEAIKLLKCAA